MVVSPVITTAARIAARILRRRLCPLSMAAAAARSSVGGRIIHRPFGIRRGGAMSFRCRLNLSAAGSGVCCLARLPAGRKKIIHNTARKARNQMVKSPSPSSEPPVDVKLALDDQSGTDFRVNESGAERVYVGLDAQGEEMTPELTATDASTAELSCDAVVVGAYAGDRIARAEEAEDLNGRLDGRL